MSNRRLPYVGYDIPGSKQTDVTKVAELIHRRRRQIALHSYLYYCLNENAITDHEYEYRVLNLIELQTRFPKIANSVKFMKRMFMEHDFSATGFHLSQYVGSSKSKDALSIKLRVGHILKHHQDEELHVFQSPDIESKISECRERIATL